MSKKFAYQVTVDDNYLAMRLARKRGVKSGESYEKELFEVLKKRNKKLKFIGRADDLDILKANLRENNIKCDRILDLREEVDEEPR